MPADRPSQSLDRQNIGVKGSAFMWEVRSFSKLKQAVVQSHTFAIDGHKWCLRIYPKGVKMDNTNLSLYLSVADPASLPNGWSMSARFCIVLINQFDEAHSMRRVAEHKFDARASSWGWESFLPLDKLRDSSGGFLVKDTFIIKLDFISNIPALENELKLTIKEELEEHDVVNAEHEDHEKKKGQGERTQAKTEKQAIQREENTENFTTTWNKCDEESRRESCLNKERECVEEEEESAEKRRTIKEKLIKCRQLWLSMTKRRKTENEAMNLTQPQLLSKSVQPIGFQKIDDLAAKKPHSSDQSQTPLENFGGLFEDIFRVVGAYASPTVSTTEAVGSIEAVEVSLSLSLLKQVADKPFCQIPSSLWPELSKAFNVLAQARSLSSAQSSAITNFSNQFENLCRSHNSNFALLGISQQFVDTKCNTFLSLKRLSESQLEIKSSLDRIRKEKDQLLNRLMELDESEFDLLEDYTAVGLKAKGVKANWDELITKDADVVRQRDKAENVLAAIETSWSTFISLFK